MTYKKGSAWKRGYWDKWSFWRKVLHVLSVIGSIIAVVIMFLGLCYIVLIYFGLLGFINHIRDTILLEMTHTIFG